MAKNRENFEFLVKILGTTKCGLTANKITEIGNFWYKFSQKGCTLLNDILQNLAWGGSPRFALSYQISPLWVQKCGHTVPKIAKIGIFGIVRKEYIPLSHFYKIWLGERVPGLHPHAQFHLCGFKNVGLQPPKSRNMVIFGIHLPLQENSGGSQKKLNIGAQLETFLYAMTS